MNTSNNRVEEKEIVTVPFKQLLYLVLVMEADKANDEKKIKEIRKEAGLAGIKM